MFIRQCGWDRGKQTQSPLSQGPYTIKQGGQASPLKLSGAWLASHYLVPKGKGNGRASLRLIILFFSIYNFSIILVQQTSVPTLCLHPRHQN